MENFVLFLIIFGAVCFGFYLSLLLNDNKSGSDCYERSGWDTDSDDFDEIDK